ncbi:TDT family transporter [Vibrio maerlii]|uniref:TDT family transporter n=1 Tax=Vibrio maerlii TaxID=2231648 RepID=UPI000E3D0727|nr:TDT family transporter [Vibrio maerlii]
MLKRIKTFSQITTGAPTPMAGLALAIASLGWCWENLLGHQGYAQWASAFIATVLLLILTIKFLFHGHLLHQDLSHPVVGSVVPTYAMAWMVVSNSVVHFQPYVGNAIWLAAVILHLVFLVSFIYHRAKEFRLHHMVPSWFVPPVGIVVADVSFSGVAVLEPVAHGALIFGLVTYAVMLPMMIYRIVFRHEIPDAAKPTIAILAAPASLTLAGYLSVTAAPSPVLVALLFGIAILMTSIIYLAFFHLMKLPFSPGYAAFTFPMVIGSTALFKMADWMADVGIAEQYVAQIHFIAVIELVVATLVVGYVAVRYYYHYQPHQHFIKDSKAQGVINH